MREDSSPGEIADAFSSRQACGEGRLRARSRRARGRRLAVLARDAGLCGDRRVARAFGGDAGLARRSRRAAHLRRDHERRDARARLAPRERASLSDGDPASRRPGQDRRDRRTRPDRGRSLHPYARILSPRRIELGCAFAVRAGAAPGLCRRRQRVSSNARRPLAAGIHDPRRQAGALEAGGFDGLGQADGLATQPQLQIRGDAGRAEPEALARTGELAVPDAAAGFACHHAAGGEFASRRGGGAGRAAGRAASAPPRRLERMGDRGIAHDDRQAYPRQRPASRTRRPDPMVSGAHRDAGGRRQGRHRPRRTGCAARAERIDRMGLHQRRHRHAGSVRRDGRSRQPRAVLDPGRTEAVRDPRRDDPCQQRRSRRGAAYPRDAAWTGDLGRQSGTRRPRRPRQGDRARLHRPRR